MNRLYILLICCSSISGCGWQITFSGLDDYANHTKSESVNREKEAVFTYESEPGYKAIVHGAAGHRCQTGSPSRRRGILRVPACYLVVYNETNHALAVRYETNKGRINLGQLDPLGNDEYQVPCRRGTIIGVPLDDVLSYNGVYYSRTMWMTVGWVETASLY